MVTAGFNDWEEVPAHLFDGHRLFRSSTPHYSGSDQDQRLDGPDPNFLRQRGIDHVVSLNHHAKNRDIKAALEGHGITYTPLPVPDFHVPQLNQLENGFLHYRNHQRTLVWCGFGHGRTGTMVSAIQIWSDKARNGAGPRNAQLNANYRRAINHVEKDDSQIDILGRILGENRVS